MIHHESALFDKQTWQLGFLADIKTTCYNNICIFFEKGIHVPLHTIELPTGTETGHPVEEQRTQKDNYDRTVHQTVCHT